MSLNGLIITTLKDIGVPVSFQRYNGTDDTYITFFEYNQSAALRADDEEQQTSHSIQVNVFSKGNYSTLVQQVKSKLKSVGFTRTMETELYEDDTQLYHKVLRFSYATKSEEE